VDTVKGEVFSEAVEIKESPIPELLGEYDMIPFFCFDESEGQHIANEASC